MNRLLSDEQIAQILEHPKVQEARTQLGTGHQLSFSADLPEPIRHSLQESWGVSTSSDIPMRWIRGDTPAHVDAGRTSFERTHLAYLTDSIGEFIIGEESYPITRGAAFTFNQGVRHEARNTGTEPRLLIGPMSEQGFPVGGGTLYYYPTQMDANNGSNLLGTYTVGAPTPLTVGLVTSGTTGGYTNWYSWDIGAQTASGPYANGYNFPNVTTYFLYPAPNVPCFPEGTRILTAEGYKVVEHLTTDDKVQTADGRFVRPTIFKIPIHHTTIDTAPYRIEAGAFGASYPPHDICLSPMHAILDNKGVWHIPQVAAKDNDKVTQYDVGKPITYYHIE